MNYNLITNLGTCMPSVLAMLNGNLGLLYYSHIPIIIISLFLGFFVLLKGEGTILSKVFFSLLSVFTIWSILDLFTWLSFDTRIIMFAWSLTGIVEIFFFILSLYFVYVFIEKKDVSLVYKILSGVILLPLVASIFTQLNLTGFDVGGCYALENSFSLNYKYTLEIISFTIIVVFSIIKYKQADKEFRKQIKLLFLGVTLFLFSFFSAVFLGGYLSEQGIITGYGFEIYGLFGTTIFMASMTFLIVKFKAFNIKILGTQVLVWALVILVGSQFLYLNQMPISSIVINAITLFISAVIGLMIVRGVKSEIILREQVQDLASNIKNVNNRLEYANFSLETANEKLKEIDQLKTEFVSLATHQLRAPLTAMKGYASMILQGDFGNTPEPLREPVVIIYESAKSLESIVEDFLNVSRIEQGKIQYDFQKVDLNELTKESIKELKPIIDKTKLSFSFDDTGESIMVNGDPNKLKQIILNFIDNSLKYTISGGVQVHLETVDSQGKKVARFSVKDTGIGISKETLPKLFKKFSRAKDANKTNISGIGLGLFVAKKMIDAHKGRLWVESEGEGKGSTFYMELATV
ncbi:MAG: ATP-binding protein [Minisyncoccia bacterium]